MFISIVPFLIIVDLEFEPLSKVLRFLLQVNTLYDGTVNVNHHVGI